MKTIALSTVTATGGAGITNAQVRGFDRAFKQAASYCPPANSPAGWQCRMNAGYGGMLR